MSSLRRGQRWAVTVTLMLKAVAVHGLVLRAPKGHGPHTQTHSPFTAVKLHQCPPELCGEPREQLSGGVCCLSVCLQREGEPDWPGSSCAGAGGNGLWADIWVRRKCPALSLDTAVEHGQMEQGACTGVRSLQGSLSAVISCELTALGSLKAPDRSQPEERQQRSLSKASLL